MLQTCRLLLHHSMVCGTVPQKQMNRITTITMGEGPVTEDVSGMVSSSSPPQIAA